MAVTGAKINLGCGTNVIEGWYNYDHPDPAVVGGMPHESIQGVIDHDLSNGIPHDDATVAIVYSEHVIEHLEKGDAEDLLRDCYRVLQPGGHLRIGWPALELTLRAYFLRSRRYREYVSGALAPSRTGSWDEFFSDTLFSWNHRYAYTTRHMKLLLGQIGFHEIKSYRSGQSGLGLKVDFRDDPATRYVEGVKPDG